MKTVCLTIKPETSFSTEIKGDTLFSLMCWHIREKYGEERLEKLLTGYCDDTPFMVVSDAFIHSYFLRPTIPLSFFETNADSKERKDFKRKKWINKTFISKPICEWKDYLEAPTLMKTDSVVHNTINPETGTTGSDVYAPFVIKTNWYTDLLDIYVLYDDAQINLSEITDIMNDIGLSGYGKASSRGHGKFSVIKSEETMLMTSASTTYMTLSPCIPDYHQVDIDKSYYRVFTRFGKHHANEDVSFSPFKMPILTAQTGAVFEMNEQKQFIGRGVNNISHNKKTVYQGYAIVVSIIL